MAKLDLNFDNFKNIEQPVSEILPVGEYTMQIIKSEVRDTKAGTGWYLQLEFDVLSGPCQPGRKFWDRLNLKNTNEQAEQIAQRQLHAIYTSNLCVLLSSTRRTSRVAWRRSLSTFR